MPVLAAASRRYRSLAEAAGSLLPPPGGTRSGGSVFTTLSGGLGQLPVVLAKASGADLGIEINLQSKCINEVPIVVRLKLAAPL